MNEREIFSLGLGLEVPWKLTDQRLDRDKNPHELFLKVEAQRGASYPCPECGRPCKAHDFTEKTWRHLNFFQHHCYITAPVPRVKCPEHGIKRIQVPWARKGSRFTLLFEQAAMSLVREMPVRAAAGIMSITDKRLWRIVQHYVSCAIARLDLAGLKAVGLDETASKRGHNYVTVFIDLDRRDKPIIFAIPGKGKKTVRKFKEFLETHNGDSSNIVEVVCDMSPAFLAAVEEQFENAEVTVDWFHVVQQFTGAVDEVRRYESRERKMPRATRWAVLKGSDKQLTRPQQEALAELEEYGLYTAIAYRAKEKLRWVRKAVTLRAARWRLTRFINHLLDSLEECEILTPVWKALLTVLIHKERILSRWKSLHSNARIEGFNSLFQAARSRARGYRNTETFITMIYLIGAPLGDLVFST